MVNLNVRIDETEHAKLVQTCTQRGCDKSTIVRQALWEYLKGVQAAGDETAMTKPRSLIHPAKMLEDYSFNNSLNKGNSGPKVKNLRILYPDGRVDYFDDNNKLKQRTIRNADGSYTVRFFSWD